MAMTHRPCDDCGELVTRERARGAIPRRCESCKLVHRKQVKKSVAARHYAKNREQVLSSTARYRAENPEQVRETNREAKKKWVAANREKYNKRNRERRRERYATDPEYRERVRLRAIAYRYGLTEERYRQMIEDQGGVCAICGTENSRSLHIDHDHRCCPERKWSCGDCVRGLLCDGCNFGVGSFKDDVARLRAAADYLESFDS